MFEHINESINSIYPAITGTEINDYNELYIYDSVNGTNLDQVAQYDVVVKDALKIIRGGN